MKLLLSAALTGALVLGAATPSAVAAETASQCGPNMPGGPFAIDATCVDPSYGKPVIDNRTSVDGLLLVEGHFEGPGTKFRIFLPPKNQWEGRFFQFTYPINGQEPADNVQFGAAHGGYTVQTDGALGYRHSAAAAKFSRTVAADYYGVKPKTINGYLYGWSGGSYQTVGAIENTREVWQGAVPIVQGIPTSSAANFTSRAFAAFVLQDKKEQIVDALRPGGSGDPYLGLDDVQKAALKEVTQLGLPLESWEDFDYVANPGGLPSTTGLIQGFDATYVEDFWTKPGYLGTEDSSLGALFRAALAQDPSRRSHLAYIANHRYTLPPQESAIPGFDQYRGPDGSPSYPQRAFTPGPFLANLVSGGASFSGKITGKVIALDSTLDSDAFPVHADWYAKRVQAAMGKETNDSYRLWYTDNSDHGPFNRAGQSTRLVGYMPVIYQALEDVSAWAEQGIAPPSSTRYGVTKDSQITLPDNAAVRGGIQPTVELSGRGNTDRIEVAAGAQFDLQAKIKVPPHAGKIVSVEWDFDGDGTFESASFTANKETLVVQASHTFSSAGTYFPSIRVGSQREGDAADEFSTVQNLDRVRVVVSAR
ncbi:PKD domain-containing protein [Arthrobacter sp. StoSoilB22]|uniref:PKD domain-containing protein n=1 Tax=Arthrobacter sp. StoSoilB22 TaxID=2830996 RepID=UPI001CC6811E|nr:PKD domain-containing protein [Arthrobacter sp. StoSoilB22]BCW62888.1 hypothetical protein StoSoilB22_18610 [Arthrobacter sp. StoSoilB22]